MGVTANDDQLAKSKAEKLISGIPLMPEVLAVEVEPYMDQTGDPAFQLVFRIRRDVEVDQAFLDRFFEFSGVMQTRILHSDLDRFPYTRVEQAA